MKILHWLLMCFIFLLVQREHDHVESVCDRLNHSQLSNGVQECRGGFGVRRTSTGGLITPTGVSVTQVISPATASAACGKHCHKLLTDLNALGLTEIVVCCSNWVKQNTNFLV